MNRLNSRKHPIENHRDNDKFDLQESAQIKLCPDVITTIGCVIMGIQLN